MLTHSPHAYGVRQQRMHTHPRAPLAPACIEGAGPAAAGGQEIRSPARALTCSVCGADRVSCWVVLRAHVTETASCERGAGDKLERTARRRRQPQGCRAARAACDQSERWGGGREREREVKESGPAPPGCGRRPCKRGTAAQCGRRAAHARVRMCMGACRVQRERACFTDARRSRPPLRSTRD